MVLRVIPDDEKRDENGGVDDGMLDGKHHGMWRDSTLSARNREEKQEM